MRIAISSLAALFITLALFFVMQSMIKGGNQPIEKPGNYGVVDFVRLQQEPADNKTESVQHRLPSITTRPPHTLPVLPSQLSTSAPVDAPQLEFELEPFTALQMGKPYLDSSHVSIPKTQLPRKSANVNTTQIPDELAPLIETRLPPGSLAKVETSIKDTAVTPGSTEGVNASENATSVPGDSAPGLSFENGDDGTEAIPVFKIEPIYPRVAARRKIEGWVRLEFTITESGTVTNAVAVESKSRRTFDRSAIQALRKWRFKPGVVDGKPVSRKA